MTNKILTERLIKRDFSSLSIKNEWFWVLVKDEIEVFSRHTETVNLSDVFNKDEVIVLDYRNTGIYIVSSLPDNSDDKPFGYYKEQPLFLPIAICALPNNLDLNEAETMPLHSTLSALESIKIRNKSNLGKTISIKL